MSRNITGCYGRRPCLDGRCLDRFGHPTRPNGILTTDDGLEARLQGLVNKAMEDDLGPVEFENGLFRGVGEVTSSPQYSMRIREDLLYNQDFIALVETIVKHETEKAVEVHSKREH